jgi:hypothetical protein
MPPPPKRRQNSKSRQMMRSPTSIAAVPSNDKSHAFANASTNTHLKADQGSNIRDFAHGNHADDPMEIDAFEDNMSDDVDHGLDQAQNVTFLATARAKGAGRRKSSRRRRIVATAAKD